MGGAASAGSAGRPSSPDVKIQTAATAPAAASRIAAVSQGAGRGHRGNGRLSYGRVVAVKNTLMLPEQLTPDGLGP